MQADTVTFPLSSQDEAILEGMQQLVTRLGWVMSHDSPVELRGDLFSGSDYGVQGSRSGGPPGRDLQEDGRHLHPPPGRRPQPPVLRPGLPHHQPPVQSSGLGSDR